MTRLTLLILAVLPFGVTAVAQAPTLYQASASAIFRELIEIDTTQGGPSDSKPDDRAVVGGRAPEKSEFVRQELVEVADP